MYNRITEPLATAESQPQDNQTNHPPPPPQASIVVPPIVQNPGQQTVFIQSTGRTTFYVPSNAFIGLGISQIVCGIIGIMLQIIGIVTGMVAHEIGSGIWCSIFFIIAGSFSIVAGRSQKLCPIITCMVMSIISAVSTSVLFSLSVISAVLLPHHYYHDEYPLNTRGKTAYASSILLSILALVEAILAIVTASLCCKVVCCGRNAGEGAMVTYLPAPTGQVVYIQNPGMSGTSMAMGGTMPPPLSDQQAEALSPKTPPPDYVENPNFCQGAV